MANKNKNLNAAARAKKDKFYTQLEDIENELRHYREFFIGKTIFCNCDDPFESNFFKYFAAKFNDLELKKLITASYADSPVAGQEIVLPGFEDGRKGYLFEVDELRDWNGDGREDLNDVQYAIEHGIYKKRQLTGDLKYCAGDFRSRELIDLLKVADVVVTNPPFSVFREFIATMIAANKKFLVVGNINAITYKEIFPLIMQDKLWLGYGFRGGDPCFRVPNDYESDTRFWIDDSGQRWRSFGNLHWYTNIETEKRFWDIPLYKKYSPEKYPRYDNYDAIEVSKTAEIPVDYFGVMGVPITFLDKYNPNQFEIVGCTYSYGDFGGHADGTAWGAKINGKDIYKRIFIRRRDNGAE
ncbi:MAG: adenine-specific methyltransferase EcoRI family protein [Selenomonadaceae bacterium]|nr:adenine-specific methyltransferase EcoRI family protein [Selenomonadaceae bacterium]